MSQRELLLSAALRAVTYMDAIGTRHVGGHVDLPALRAALGGPLPSGPTADERVIAEMARGMDAGLVATTGPRYFGFVTGGAVPVTVAAEWLGSAWD
jgi:hypothetical protein